MENNTSLYLAENTNDTTCKESHDILKPSWPQTFFTEACNKSACLEFDCSNDSTYINSNVPVSNILMPR